MEVKYKNGQKQAEMSGFEFAGDSSASRLLQKNILVKGINSFATSSELLLRKTSGGQRKQTPPPPHHSSMETLHFSAVYIKPHSDTTVHITPLWSKPGHKLGDLLIKDET